LYKIADLSNLILRAYFSGDQLSQVKLNQSVKVRIDEAAGAYKTYTGKVIWVSPKSEFTPKIIQTKQDRVNFVYAVKIKVVNDGGLKMGMPAEVILN
jgi:HlyD family secretion protein